MRGIFAYMFHRKSTTETKYMELELLESRNEPMLHKTIPDAPCMEYFSIFGLNLWSMEGNIPMQHLGMNVTHAVAVESDHVGES